MPKVYVETVFFKNESPVSSRKFASWDRKIANAISLESIAIRETRGSYGVLEEAIDWSFRRFFVYDSSKAEGLRWINRTGAARAIDITPEIPYPNDVFANGDIMYLGFPFPFTGAVYYLSVNGTVGTASYTYWNEARESWDSFTPTGHPSNITQFKDGIGAYKNITWNIGDLPGWGASTLDSIFTPSGYTIDNNSLFWVRISLSGYTIYPKFLCFLTNGATRDLKVLPIYDNDGAERAIRITPGKVIIDGTIWDLDTLTRLDISQTTEVYPYYVGVIIDSRGILSTYSQITGPNPIQVIPDPESVKLADILVDGTSTIETTDITDTRVMIN